MSKIIVLILVMCALSLFSISSPCEAGLVDDNSSVNDKKSPQSDRILDGPKDSMLDNNQTSSNIKNNTEEGRSAFEFPEEGREVIVSDPRCADGQTFIHNECREDE